MTSANRKIEDFFKPKPSPKPGSSQASSGETPGCRANQLIIKSSDDEESASDSSLEDLASLLQFKSSKPPLYDGKNCSLSWNTTRPKNGRNYPTSPSSPTATKQKYHFDLKKLVTQAEIADATEESAKRVQALLDDNSIMAPAPHSFNPPNTHSEALTSFTANEQGLNVEKLLQAVRRTEAIHSDKRWHFFNPCEEKEIAVFPFSPRGAVDGWQASISDPQLREQIILSGFARDMITLKDFLPDEYFLWILDEMCTEKRTDLRDAYCSILGASEEQILRLVQPETISHLFRKLGAGNGSVDLYHKISPVTEASPNYASQDWSILRTVIIFIGTISRCLSEIARSYAISILVRLCADGLVIGDIGLLAALQRAIEQISQNITGMFWTNSSRELCNSIFFSVEEATMRFQVLRCLPRTTPRLHELRRRLALAFFFSDIGYASRPPHDHLDLWEITKQLNEQRFKIRRDTDYHELAALISILDIAIDNGQCIENNVANADVECDFNTDVDELSDRVKTIWSSINDGGASFISRVNAKEVMEGLRNRLIYGVRTKLKPKQSIFDSVSDDIKGVHKQSAMMSKYFKRDLSGS